MVIALTPDRRAPVQPLELALRRAKFRVPPVPRRLVRRDHLLSRLAALTGSEGSHPRVTLVVAPVGTGKTTLVAAAAAAGERRAGTTAWCTLDANDSDPHEFGLSVLEAILATQSPTCVGRAAFAEPTARDALDAALVIARCGSPLLLVLDECEQMQYESMHATIRRLVRQAPPNLSIVLVTNQDVPLPARVTPRFAAIRTADLAFTSEEVAEVFAQERIAVSPATVELVTRWTQGVASAVTLTVSAFRNSRDREPVLAAAERDDCSAHVEVCERLLERLAPDQRTVLLASTLVDPVSADLVSAMTDDPDAHGVLGDLVRSDVFLDAVAGCPGWYRHRHPTRELLRAELDRVSGPKVATMHSRAAHWFVERGHRRRALDSALQARDWELIFELVRARWIAASLDELHPALEGMPRIPENVARQNGDALLVAAAIDIEHSDAKSARERLALLADADTFSARAPESALFEALLHLRLARDDSSAPDIRDACYALLALCGSASVLFGLDEDVESLARRGLAEASLIDGDLDGAAQLLERVCDDATVNGHAVQAANATAALAVVTALGGRVRRGAALVDELGDAWFAGRHFCRGVGATAKALCEYHADDLVTAQVGVSEALAALRPSVYRDAIVPMIRARIASSMGDDAGAARAAKRAAACGHLALFGIAGEALGVTPAPPADAVEGLVDLGRGPTHPYAIARRSLGLAVRADETERRDDVWVPLERTLALVERNAYNRLFLDSGLQVRGVLREYIVQARPFSQVAWQQLRRLPADRAADAAPVIETLTERELAVLRHLPTMKSNREIAVEMYFSVNTVKTHLKSIYRKLGVNRRRAAVEEARARSLL